MEKFLARPPDQDLMDHLIKVADYGRDQFDALNLEFFSNTEDNKILLEIFKLSFEIIALFHDFGKATEDFQYYINPDSNKSYDPTLKQHSRYSSILCLIFFDTLYNNNFLNPNFLKRGLEINDNGNIYNFPVNNIFKQIGALSALIIRCHHSKQLFNLQLFFDELLNKNEIIENHQKRIIKTDFKYLFRIIELEIVEKFDNFQEIINLEKLKQHFSKFKKYYRTNLDNLVSDDERVRNREIRPFIRDGYKIQNCPVSLNEIIFFMSKLLFSLLIDADKINAALGDNLVSFNNFEVSEFQDNLKSHLLSEGFFIPNENFSFPFKDLNSRRRYILNKSINFQPQVANDSDSNPIIQLSVPTGFGKTFASLYLASQLSSKYNSKIQSILHPKIIYALPYLSIIEQTEKVINDFLSIENMPTNVFLVHHHLTLPKYEDKEDEYDESVSHLLIEGWNSQYILSTFHQLFNGCLKSNKYSCQKFNKIINSTWILDEIQSIPLLYWKMFSRIFKLMNKTFKTNMILMSATLPKILQNSTQSSVNMFSPHERKQIIKGINRISLEFYSKKEFSEFLEKSKEIVNDKNNVFKNILFVLNTRKTAQKLYKTLSSDKCIVENHVLGFLSASMIPIHKSLLITSIKDNLKENRKNIGKPVLLISTQCIEAGVDIDFDLVIRDFAPLENIIQVAGRCNRNNVNIPGKVMVYPIYVEIKGKRKKTCEYIYGGHKLKITYNLIYSSSKNSNSILPIKFPESEIDELVDNYYQEIDNFFKEGTSLRYLNDYFEYISSFSFKSLSDSFNLIEHQAPYSFYIEIDNKAQQIFKEYTNLISPSYEKFDIEVYNKSLIIQKKIQEYIITAYIDKKDFKKINNLQKVGNIYHIPKNNLKDFYDNIIGFKL